MSIANLNDNQLVIDQFSLKITSRLSDAANNVPHDISERLRAARVQAVDKRKWVLTQAASEVFSHGHSGTLVAGRGGAHSSWWNRLGAAGLLLALALGLFAISAIQDELGARELADIDAAILTDDLPPAAYVDAGFAQFLKSGVRQDQ